MKQLDKPLGIDSPTFWLCPMHEHCLGRDAIHGLLSGGVGVDGGHQALLNPDALLSSRVEQNIMTRNYYTD